MNIDKLAMNILITGARHLVCDIAAQLFSLSCDSSHYVYSNEHVVQDSSAQIGAQWSTISSQTHTHTSVWFVVVWWDALF